MDNVIIHACPQRMEYVNKYLVPSLENQGIDKISIRCDEYKLGNLAMCMSIFSSMNGEGGAWHIQDDVVICRDFKQRAEEFTSGIVCGFAWSNDENIQHVGYVEPKNMWWSFPCIRIPNEIARDCADWFNRVAKNEPKYLTWSAGKKYDDYFFKEYLKQFHYDEKVLNLTPNLVDHIDYLIGGTTVSRVQRSTQVRAKWFEDLDLVETLEKEFDRDKHKDG